MKLGGRLQAAEEILEDIFQHHRPANVALADWGRRHRFAGSGDRAAIATLVYDALRKKSALAWQMRSDAPRALVLAAALRAFGLTVEGLRDAAADGPHAIGALSEDECTALAGSDVASIDAPLDVKANVPEWLIPSLTRVFADRVGVEGAALSERAPIDIRVNTLKATRAKVAKALERYAPEETAFAFSGLRVAAPRLGAKLPQLEKEAAHGKGWFEIQDEGSQLAALLTGAKPGQQVLDLCAGAGGKTLALAAQMQNSGQIYAFDRDRQQLRPIFDRLRRAGVRNVQVVDAGRDEELNALGARFDAVLVDAPCTGSGTWRRRPDSKWKLKPAQLDERIAEQRVALRQAAASVKAGGRLTYVTCSVLAEENQDQVAWFLEHHGGFKIVPYGDVWRAALGSEPPQSADGLTDTLLLTPACHQTDGFFVASFERVDDGSN